MTALLFFYHFFYIGLPFDQPRVGVAPDAEVIAVVVATNEAGQTEGRPVYGPEGKSVLSETMLPKKVKGFRAVTGEGNLVQAVDLFPNVPGTPEPRPWLQFRYDSASRVDTVRQWDSAVVRVVEAYHRDARGRVDSISVSAWDSLGRDVQAYGVKLVRDSAGRIVEWHSSLRTGNDFGYRYDSLGRLVERRLLHPTFVYADSFFYDDKGRWSRLSQWVQGSLKATQRFEYAPLSGLPMALGPVRPADPRSRVPGGRLFRYSGFDALGRALRGRGTAPEKGGPPWR